MQSGFNSKTHLKSPGERLLLATPQQAGSTPALRYKISATIRMAPDPGIKKEDVSALRELMKEVEVTVSGCFSHKKTTSSVKEIC